MRSNKEEISDLCKELSKTLVKDKKEDLENFGTTIMENMTYDYQRTLEKRFISLQKEFNLIDKDGNSKITFDELYNFFHGKNQNITKEELEKIFVLFDKDKNQEITINEFIYSYMNFEEQLKIKREKLRNVQNNLKEKTKEFEKKKKLYENEPKENSISKQSEVTLNIKNGKNFKSKNSQILLKYFDGPSKKEIERKNTNLKQNSFNPIFNEEFIFHVKNLTDFILIEAIEPIAFNYNYNKIGSAKIFLKDHDNQIKHEISLKLNNNNNNNNNDNNNFNNNNNNNNFPILNLSVRFRYDNYKYYDDIITKTNIQIKRLDEVLSELDSYQIRFQQPFGLIVANKANELIKEDFIHKDTNPNHYLSSFRSSVYLNNDINKKNLLNNINNYNNNNNNNNNGNNNNNNGNDNNNNKNGNNNNNNVTSNGNYNNNIFNSGDDLKDILDNKNLDFIDYNESVDNIRNSLYRNSHYGTPNQNNYYINGNNKNNNKNNNNNNITPNFNLDTYKKLNEIQEENSNNIISSNINDTNNNNNNNNNVKSSFNNNNNNLNNNNNDNLNNNNNNNFDNNDNNNNNFNNNNNNNNYNNKIYNNLNLNLKTPNKFSLDNSNKDFTTNINENNFNNNNNNNDSSSHLKKINNNNNNNNNIFNINNFSDLKNNKILSEIKKIPSNNWKKYLSLGGLLLSLLNSFGRNDLISTAIYLYSLLNENENENENKNENKKNFFSDVKNLIYGLYGSLGIDLLWLIFG
jgi:hypothetical protein